MNRWIMSIILAAAVFAPFAADAQSPDLSALKEQINSLLSQVSLLQEELARIQGGATSNTTGASIVFNTTLSVGASGEDVRRLQEILNRDPDTKISASGPGSLGNETTYFGLLTYAAVLRFQEKYRDEVLFPAGLQRATGVVGPLTRKKLNALASAPVVKNPPVDQPESLSPVPTLPSGDISGLSAEVLGKAEGVVISQPSSYAAPRGTAITLYGAGFTAENNTVVVGNSTLQGIKGAGGSLGFTVPASAPFGKHSLSVRNVNGESNETFFVVTDPSLPAPKVLSVSPSSADQGGSVTITGSGFTPTGNEIISGMGVISDIPSADGTTLRFNALPDTPLQNQTGEEISWPVTLYVINNGGISKDPAHFTLTF